MNIQDKVIENVRKALKENTNMSDEELNTLMEEVEVKILSALYEFGIYSNNKKATK